MVPSNICVRGRLLGRLCGVFLRQFSAGYAALKPTRSRQGDSCVAASCIRPRINLSANKCIGTFKRAIYGVRQRSFFISIVHRFLVESCSYDGISPAPSFGSSAPQPSFGLGAPAVVWLYSSSKYSCFQRNST